MRRPAPGWPANPASDDDAGEQLRLDVAEQAGRCRQCRRRPAVVGPLCVACCARADVEADAHAQGDGGQAASSGNAGAAALPDRPGADDA